jgi:hypothetical protein
MGIPVLSAYVDALYDFSGDTIAAYVRDNVPDSERILDIGAGWGKYRFILPEYEMDCVEIWLPNIQESNLNSYYRKVYHQDISKFKYPNRYGCVIFGDVLEHMSVENAQRAIRAACANSDFVCVTVPYEMPQPADDNPHEEHIQEDLTRAVMEERYPELECLAEEGHKAVYVKRIAQ